MTLADEGETETLTVVVDAPTVKSALALLVGSAALVARTVTVVEVVTFGAVKIPALVIVPALADQVTEVLLVPCTVAENCCVPAEDTLALVGEMEILTVDPEAELITM